tara:strand:+ start:588 stop:785 length:198 start_codon:yes stop_codon:yes gene_type:complete
MDYYIAQSTLKSLEQVIYDINIKVLKEVHKKYLKDLDFKNLKEILDNVSKITYHIEVSDEESDDD